MLHRSILPAFSRRSLGRHLRWCSISGAAKNTTFYAFGHLSILDFVLAIKKIKISIFFSSSCIFFNIFFNCIYREFFLINSENDKTVIPVLDTGIYMQNRLSYKILWSSQRMTVYITSQDDNDKYSSNPKSQNNKR